MTATDIEVTIDKIIRNYQGWSIENFEVDDSLPVIWIDIVNPNYYTIITFSIDVKIKQGQITYDNSDWYIRIKDDAFITRKTLEKIEKDANRIWSDIEEALYRR